MTDFYGSVLLPALPYLKWGGIGLGGAILALFLYWNITPFVVLWRLPGVSGKHKARATVSFIRAVFNDTFCILFGLTAFFMVPRALRKTPWEAEQLPGKWNKWYGNNVGINGDRFQWVVDPVLGYGVPLPIPLETDGPRGELAVSLCYYAPGRHPRSNEARYKWLTRNRSSLLGVHLGREWQEPAHEVVGGDPLTSTRHEGWCLTRCGSVYQLFRIKRNGDRVRKQSWGNKVGPTRDTSYFRAPAVWRTLGFGDWDGPQ